MVVRDFDVGGIFTLPPETNAKLVVDTDAVLPNSVAAQSF